MSQFGNKEILFHPTAAGGGASEAVTDEPKWPSREWEIAQGLLYDFDGEHQLNPGQRAVVEQFVDDYRAAHKPNERKKHTLNDLSDLFVDWALNKGLSLYNSEYKAGPTS